ncbi:Aste57867_15646 [Aphanomyces stellatus]|uniref:Aste57867_15646 protein n=1 Tax=Aphanomyces stellatus TaxID=120398 RepID=A0A485L3K1_9STRA|nr:hypothetical protein As57867_015590 [Aphanomyces stellatus]VFT92442.1 Aste57867_15646 [Aphanomyces stellatus]
MMEVLVALVAIAVTLIWQNSLHRVDEGYVGVYWKGGQLLETTSTPGTSKASNVSLVSPTSHHDLVAMKTTMIRDVPCGTASGVLVHFHQVEIVHRLHPQAVLDTVRNYDMRFENLWIIDVAYHEINLLCSTLTLHQVYISHFDQMDELLKTRLSETLSTWAPGLAIISIRFTKPLLPDALRESYELVDQEKAKLLMATEYQRTVLKEAETDMRNAVLECEKELSLSVLHMQKWYEQTLARQNISRIQDAMTLSRRKDMADATFYKQSLETKSFATKLTPSFLTYLRATAGLANVQIYFGDKVPHTLFEAPSSALVLANHTG